MTIHGKVIDPNYTALLMEQKDLPLEAVILLDRIQKRLPIDRDEAKRLRRQKLIEGRYPNPFVAAHIASASGDKAQYIKNRAFDDDHYKKMIVSYLKKYGQSSRKDIDTLLMDKLSDVLTPEQKRNKIRNLLSAMSRAGTIRNDGPRGKPKWVLD